MDILVVGHEDEITKLFSVFTNAAIMFLDGIFAQMIHETRDRLDGKTVIDVQLTINSAKLLKSKSIPQSMTTVFLILQNVSGVRHGIENLRLRYERMQSMRPSDQTMFYVRSRKNKLLGLSLRQTAEIDNT